MPTNEDFVMPEPEESKKRKEVAGNERVTIAVAQATSLMAAKLISHAMILSVLVISGVALVLVIAVAQIDWFYPIVGYSAIAYFAWQRMDDDLGTPQVAGGKPLEVIQEKKVK